MKFKGWVHNGRFVIVNLNDLYISESPASIREKLAEIETGACLCGVSQFGTDDAARQTFLDKYARDLFNRLVKIVRRNQDLEKSRNDLENLIACWDFKSGIKAINAAAGKLSSVNI